MKLQEQAQRQAQHVMVYGDAKTGKSTLVSKLAEAGFNLIWLSVDGGHVVLYKLSQEAQERINLIVTPDTRDSPFAFDTCRRLLKGKAIQVCHLHGVCECSVCKKDGRALSPYELRANPLNTIFVIDHMTRVADSDMNVISRGKPVDYKLQLDDYGAWQFHLREVLTDIQVAPFHIVCIAQAVEVVMEDKSKKINPAIGSSEFTKLTCQYFDHVVYCKIQNRSHKFGSGTTFETSVVTGSRLDIKLEDMGAEASLVPFFDGSALPKQEQLLLNGSKQAAEVLAAPIEQVITAASELQATSAATAVTPAAVQQKLSTQEMLARLKQGRK